MTEPLNKSPSQDEPPAAVPKSARHPAAGDADRVAQPCWQCKGSGFVAGRTGEAWDLFMMDPGSRLTAEQGIVNPVACPACTAVEEIHAASYAAGLRAGMEAGSLAIGILETHPNFDADQLADAVLERLGIG